MSVPSGRVWASTTRSRAPSPGRTLQFRTPVHCRNPLLILSFGVPVPDRQSLPSLSSDGTSVSPRYPLHAPLFPRTTSLRSQCFLAHQYSLQRPSVPPHPGGTPESRVLTIQCPLENLFSTLSSVRDPQFDDPPTVSVQSRPHRANKFHSVSPLSPRDTTH